MITAIAIVALLALSVGILRILDRQLSRPTFRELTRFPGNEAALERYLYRRRRMSPQLFLPTDVGQVRSSEQ